MVLLVEDGNEESTCDCATECMCIFECDCEDCSCEECADEPVFDNGQWSFDSK